jgi:hypothetical protein
MSDIDSLPTIPCPNIGTRGTGVDLGLDLLAMGIHAIGRLFERGD